MPFGRNDSGCRGCRTHCSIPGLYPLDTRRILLLSPHMTTRNISGHCQLSPRGRHWGRALSAQPPHKEHEGLLFTIIITVFLMGRDFPWSITAVSLGPAWGWHTVGAQCMGLECLRIPCQWPGLLCAAGWNLPDPPLPKGRSSTT